MVVETHRDSRDGDPLTKWSWPIEELEAFAGDLTIGILKYPTLTRLPSGNLT